jgi:hypothetical protein
MPVEVAGKDKAPESAGAPLASSVRQPIESSFGTSLGHVRVHSSPAVDQVGACAFTYGSNIFLGSRESPSDLGLMAHESAHVIHQSSSPAVQFSGGGVANRFETEAESASAAVVSGASFQVRGRTAGRLPQFSWLSGAVSAVGSVARSAVSAVADAAGAIRDRVLQFLSEHANSIPGFQLLTVILGRNPFTGQAVERNAVNLIRGFMGLIPGGDALFEKIQQTQVIQRAYQWFSEEIPKLDLTWDAITGMFRRAWDSLSASDLLSPSGVFARMRGLFGPPLSRLINFARAAADKLLEFVIEGALRIAGDAGGRVMALIRRAGGVFRTIVNDPIAFGRNLIAAVRGGFERFRGNVVEHLRNGLIGWLTGAMAGIAITLPGSFSDWRGIIGMVLDILGLTYQLFRRLLVRALGEERVRFLEGVFDFLRILVTQGVRAAWEKIKEYSGNLTDMVIGGIRDWVARTVVGQAIVRLISLLNPVGAIIQTAIAIYNTVMFFVERIQQIMALANSVFDSIANIASGNIGGAISYVEQAMARTLPVIISFLARLIGLDGISARIREIIQRIQQTIERTFERIIDWIVTRVRGLIGGRAAAATPQDAAPPVGPMAVKARALQVLRARTRGQHIASTEQLAGVVRGVLNELRPAGLQSLSVRMADVERARFQLSAAASEPVNEFVLWNELFEAEDLAGPQIQALRDQFSTAGMETYGAVSVDGELIGSVTNNSQGHAEERLLSGGTWESALNRVAAYRQMDQDRTITVALIINRAPCGAICTPALTRAVIAARNRFRSDRVHFVLAATGDYRPAGSGSLTPAQARAQLAQFARTRGVGYLEAIERNVNLLIQQAPNARDLRPTSVAGLTLLEAAGWDIRVLATRPFRRTNAGDIIVPTSLRDLAEAVRSVKAQFASDFNARMTSR